MLVPYLRESFHQNPNKSQWEFFDLGCTQLDQFLLTTNLWWKNPFSTDASVVRWMKQSYVSPCGNCSLSDEQLLRIDDLLFGNFLKESRGTKRWLIWDSYL